MDGKYAASNMRHACATTILTPATNELSVFTLRKCKERLYLYTLILAQKLGLKFSSTKGFRHLYFRHADATFFH